MQVLLSAELLGAVLGASEWREFLLELCSCLHHSCRKLKQPPVSTMAEALEEVSGPSVELEAEVAEGSADVEAEAQQEVSAPWKLKRPLVVLKLKQHPPLAHWNRKLKQPPSALSASAPSGRPSLGARRRAPCG